MKQIQMITRRMHEYYEKNPGVCVAYFGSVRTWMEGCRLLAEKMLEQLFLHQDRTEMQYLIGRMKWLWDREHFLDAEETKSLESFYDATLKEVSKRMHDTVENLKLTDNGNSI